MIKENIIEVQNKIKAACLRAGRSEDEVTLMAVSKTKPAEMVKEAYDFGQKTFGENYVQEIVEKYDILPKDIHWHMIGHLQRNKVKYIIDKVEMIHSVDSMRLAETIDKEAKKHNLIAKILIEVNVGEEDSKFGLKTNQVLSFVEEISHLKNIEVCGLMTSAPFVENAEENRLIFRELKKLSVDIAQKNYDNVNVSVLSMGMTNDYEVAVEEGATVVRVGTAIFGARNYANA